MTGQPDPRRRTFVGLAGAAAAGPVVAACGADPARDRRGSDPGSSATASPTDDPTATPSRSARPDEEPSETERPGKPLVAVADVPVGGGAVLARERLVVTQPAKGRFRAFSAVCTHQGCLVASVDDEQIICSCHGSRFGIADGAVEQGPAQQRLAEVPVEVGDGQVRRA